MKTSLAFIMAAIAGVAACGGSSAPPKPTKPSDGDAMAFIERWITDLRGRGDALAAAVRAVNGADVTLGGHRCGTSKDCVMRGRVAAHNAARLEASTTERFRVLRRSDDPNVTWVEWVSSTVDGGASNYEHATIALGLGLGRDGTTQIVAADIRLAGAVAER